MLFRQQQNNIQLGNRVLESIQALMHDLDLNREEIKFDKFPTTK